MAAPVTVIIATYNWSAALRVSIASVLAQTHREFELLVIGDCCTDDSAEVVRSFADPRVQWWDLPIRHGSQSGPNNYGIEIASGRFIAYLGHDDVWHPDHLRFLLAKIEETGADMVCGLCIMYGPAGSGVRFVSGMFVEGRYRRQDFLPPSSLMHRRDLTARIGPWGRPEDLSAPVDCDLLERAFQAGASIVSTERLTVFKFNSAWRRNSYLRRDVSEQQRMLERLTTAPVLCVEEEWAGLLRARREHRLFESWMPDATDQPPGFRHRTLLRARGLENGDSGVLLTPGRFTMEAQDAAMDWYAPEQVAEWGSCRWTGPSPTALITLPIRLASQVRFRLQILNWFRADLAQDVRLSVAGVKLEFTCREMRPPAVCLEGALPAAESAAGPLRLEIAVARLRCPHFESGGQSSDIRWLGVCVSWLELTPVG